MDNIRENVSVLTLLAEVLCLLDMIVNSFAHMISTKPVDRYTRPEFTGNKLIISIIFLFINEQICLLIFFLDREWAIGN